MMLKKLFSSKLQLFSHSHFLVILDYWVVHLRYMHGEINDLNLLTTLILCRFIKENMCMKESSTGKIFFDKMTAIHLLYNHLCLSMCLSVLVFPVTYNLKQIYILIQLLFSTHKTVITLWIVSGKRLHNTG